jgi:HSP20 family protein
MVDDGDRYNLTVELPRIEKDNIHVKAMDDSVEIPAEQSQEEDERKKNFVYNYRSYSSFYCRIPSCDQEEGNERSLEWSLNDDGVLDLYME